MHFLNPTYLISVLIAVSVHEWAHAMTADRLGDPTPGHAGRLTLNPLAHIDLVGALMFLIVGFGWAKPVPINSSYFRHPRQGTAITALAGPFSNLCLAIIAFTALLFIAGGAQPESVFDLLSPLSGFAAGKTVFIQILQSSLFVNLALMAFNLFPIAPLDGSNILQMFIPYQYMSRYEDIMRVGPFILLFLIFFETFLPIHLLTGWVFGIMSVVLSIFTAVAGAIGL